MLARDLPRSSFALGVTGHDSPDAVHARRHFAGCLLGGAVGDALGAPVEFMGRREILARFGRPGITGYAPAYGITGGVTDDTQMTLFTAEALIRHRVRHSVTTPERHHGHPGHGDTLMTITAHAYLRWLETQEISALRRFGFENDPTGWLFLHPALHARRAPGNTCLSALRAMTDLGAPACNDSKGCGGVMRVAPVGLVGPHDEAHLGEVFRRARDMAALTHGHPSGVLSAGALAVMVARLVAGDSLTTALARARRELLAYSDHAETLAALDRAEHFAAAGVTPDQAIPQLGEGWVAEEALAISVYCALVARDFRAALIMAVNHDGDSDSTGALTGNLLGARDGVDVIPPEWLAPLELREVIQEIARDLHDCQDWPLGERATDPAFNDHVWEKYPGW